jgi:hypothetical protein
MKRTIIYVVIVVAGCFTAGWLTWGAIDAHAATALNGHCGMHIGKLVRRNQGGSLYKFRIGPKDANLGTLRPTTCRGQVRVHRRAAAPSVGALAWTTYSAKGWNRHTTLLVGTGTATVIGCYGTGRALVGIIGVLVAGGTDGLAYPLLATAAGSFGCGVGAHALVNLIPDGPDTLDKVRMIK